MQVYGFFQGFRGKLLKFLVGENRKYWINGRWSIIAFYVFFGLSLAFFLTAETQIKSQPYGFIPDILQNLSPLQLALGIGLLASMLANFAHLAKKDGVLSLDFLKSLFRYDSWRSLFLFSGCGLLIGVLDAFLHSSKLVVLGDYVDIVFIIFAVIGVSFFCLYSSRRVTRSNSFTKAIIASNFTFFVFLLFFLAGWYAFAHVYHLISGLSMIASGDYMLLVFSVMLFIAPALLELLAFVLLFGALAAVFVGLIPIYSMVMISAYTVGMITLFILEKKMKKN